ncbi:hypothetical protein HDU93_002489 [Gonapodya sp. JEL0774]|nr:hypothetical protein HDU93_002489 [Gonapodya sp. JEL0774]
MNFQIKSTKVDPHGLILKQIPPLTFPDPSLLAPQWIAGSNAVIHYTAWTYITQDENAARTELEEWGILSDKSSEHDHRHCNHDRSAESACRVVLERQDKMCDVDHQPYRHKVGDTRQRGEPLDLRVGKKFIFEGVETCLKTMRVKERSMFVLMPTALQGFVQLETQLRQQHLNKQSTLSGGGGNRQVPTHRCSATLTTDDYMNNRDLISVYTQPLELEIEFLQFQPPGTFDKCVWEMTLEEKWIESQKKKEKGNRFCNEGKYADARSLYEEALQLTEQILKSTVICDHKRDIEWIQTRVTSRNEASEDIKEGHFPTPLPTGLPKLEVLETLPASLHLNLAFVHLKMEPPDNTLAVHHSSKVLETNPDSVKGLYRRAIAYRGQGDWEKARIDLQQALKLEREANGEGTQKGSLHSATVDIITKEMRLLDLEENKAHMMQRKMFLGLFT